MSHIIICEEKHSTRYWDASTHEAWAVNALAILTERWNQGYWYHDPDDDGLGTTEWAEKQRAQRAQALAMSKEEIEALPEVARKPIIKLRNEARRDTEYDRQHRAWYEHAKAVVEAQDTGDQTVGRGRRAREEPKAWVLLEERSDHEYERVEMEQLETRFEVEKGLGALEP